MSGIYLLVVLAAWVGLSGALWKGWRRWRTQEGGNQRVRDAAALVGGILWIGTSFWYAGGQKVYYDAQVNRLCKRDGGIKVYETVKLPAEKFDKYGQVNFYKPTQGKNALGEEYVLRTDVQYLRRGDPFLRRYHVQVLRREGRLLGESIGYDRGGGDLPGPWQPSSFSCPQHHGEAVIERVFVRDQGAQR